MFSPFFCVCIRSNINYFTSFLLDYSPTDVERDISILGADDDAQRARSMVMEVIAAAAERNATRNVLSGGHTFNNVQANPGETIQHLVPAGKVGLVIGRGGETIKMLQEQSGARIAVTPGKISCDLNFFLIANHTIPVMIIYKKEIIASIWLGFYIY